MNDLSMSVLLWALGLAAKELEGEHEKFVLEAKRVIPELFSKAIPSGHVAVPHAVLLEAYEVARAHSVNTALKDDLARLLKASEGES